MSRLDHIRLNGLTFRGCHGALPAEQELGQMFYVDLTIETDRLLAGLSDRLDDAVNYAEIYDRARAVVEGPPHRLIESLAEELAEEVLALGLARSGRDGEGSGAADRVRAVTVVVHKPQAPLPGPFADVAVQIRRRQPAPTRGFLSLGSNEGDRRAILLAALAAIDRLPGTRLLRASSIWETEPVGPVEQGWYLNLAAEVETRLGPVALLKRLQAIESELGRRREGAPRWGPRLIDIDLISLGSYVSGGERLTLPHPRASERAFVLFPLDEIAPALRLPPGGDTVGEHLARLAPAGQAPPGQRLRLFDGPPAPEAWGSA